METLEHPPIVADEVVDRADPAVSKEVALATLRTTALSELSAVDRGIAELRQAHGATDYDIKTPKGYKLATEHRHAVRLARYKVPHIVKARKAELKEIGEAVGKEGDRIIAALQAIEDPHDALIVAEDNRVAAEKAERERIEAERVAGHRARIAAIRECVTKSRGITSERIAAGIVKVQAQTTDEVTFQEFAREAADAKAETIASMQALFDSTKAAEDAAIAAEAQRVEQARVAEEQRVERQRLADESARMDEARALIAKAEREAAEKIEADRKALAEERAAWLAEQEAAKPKPAFEETHPEELTEVRPRDEGMAPEACESATGRGEQVAPALAIAPTREAPDESAQAGGKDVLGGHAEERPPLASDVLMLLRDSLALTKYAAAPFFSKFPTHPKTTPEWWAGLREQIEILQPLLAKQIEALEV